jgi:hypothetical protein
MALTFASSTTPRLPVFIPVDLIGGSAVLGSVAGFMLAEVVSRLGWRQLDPLRWAGLGAGYIASFAMLYWLLVLVAGVSS